MISSKKYPTISLYLFLTFGSMCAMFKHDDSHRPFEGKYIPMGRLLLACVFERKTPLILAESTPVIFFHKESNVYLSGTLAKKEKFTPFFVNHKAKIMREDPTEQFVEQCRIKTFAIAINGVYLEIPADDVWIDTDYLPKDIKTIA